MVCPVCGKEVRLTKAGKVGAHKRFRPWGRSGSGMPSRSRCEGTGRKP